MRSVVGVVCSFEPKPGQWSERPIKPIRQRRRKRAKESAADAERMTEANRCGTHECGAWEAGIALSDAGAFLSRTRNAPAGGRGSDAPFGNFHGNVGTPLRKMTFTSRGAANCCRRGRSIRKNIIGHGAGQGMSVRWKQFLARCVFRGPWRPLALFDQPARKHGASILLHPLLEQGANLLPEVGRVAETRKLVALQRVTRCREKELPRRLGVGTGHVGLQETRSMEGNKAVINVHST